jgi:hypothetical protein
MMFRDRRIGCEDPSLLHVQARNERYFSSFARYLEGRGAGED